MHAAYRQLAEDTSGLALLVDAAIGLARTITRLGNVRESISANFAVARASAAARSSAALRPAGDTSPVAA